MLVIPAVKEGSKSEASLGKLARPCLQTELKMGMDVTVHQHCQSVASIMYVCAQKYV